MMNSINFRPITLSDGIAIQDAVYSTDCRNCDLNFMNLMSWRFLFQTELAFYHDWLLFRFRVDGHLAYLPPIGPGRWKDVVLDMVNDAHLHGEKFCLMGVCQHSLEQLTLEMPDDFVSSVDRSYTDYVYRRETLSTLSGKKLQPKRNFVNRFAKLYADYQYTIMGRNDFEECIALLEKWHQQKKEDRGGRLTLDEEHNALQFVFENWEALQGRGGVLRVDGQVVAFTYGAPINYDTFDVCVEKADPEYEGAFAMINREFARSLPDNYVYVNREEDLGIEGLRKAKLSYQPDILLHKHTVTLKSETETFAPQE